MALFFSLKTVRHHDLNGSYIFSIMIFILMGRNYSERLEHPHLNEVLGSHLWQDTLRLLPHKLRLLVDTPSKVAWRAELGKVSGE